MTRALLALVVWMAMFAIAGCVERSERLTISPDGSVLWQVRMRSDSLDDLLNDDAVPTPGGLWIVSQDQERDVEGKVTHVLSAETAIGPRRKLPSGFGGPQAVADHTCLAFPTTITFERRRDGTYCHFTRRYEQRVWREVEALREQHVQQVVGDLDDDPSTWTPQQRLTLVQCLVRFEIEKNVHFLRQAWLTVAMDEPQDGYLAMADGVRSITLAMDFERLVNLLATPEDQRHPEALEQAIELESQQLQALIESRMRESADRAGLDASKVNAVMAAWNVQQEAYDVTQDLNDDAFEIEVEMPGIVIASNAKQIGGGVSGNVVSWSFKGADLHDRSVELLATSKIPR